MIFVFFVSWDFNNVLHFGYINDGKQLLITMFHWYTSLYKASLLCIAAFIISQTQS